MPSGSGVSSDKAVESDPKTEQAIGMANNIADDDM